MTLCRSRGEPENGKGQSAKGKSANSPKALLAPCSMPYAKTHRPIASLWRGRLSIGLMRE
jgi:hypothetical protein